MVHITTVARARAKLKHIFFFLSIFSASLFFVRLFVVYVNIVPCLYTPPRVRERQGYKPRRRAALHSGTGTSAADSVRFYSIFSFAFSLLVYFVFVIPPSPATLVFPALLRFNLLWTAENATSDWSQPHDLCVCHGTLREGLSNAQGLQTRDTIAALDWLGWLVESAANHPLVKRSMASERFVFPVIAGRTRRTPNRSREEGSDRSGGALGFCLGNKPHWCVHI